MIETIRSRRLVLTSLGIPLLETLLRGDRDAAGKVLDCRIPADLTLDDMPLERRLKQLRADASEEPWLVRAMIDRASRTMIGHIGFHTPPRPDYLAEIAADGIELGYTVHAAHRRKGYATEAALALMHWAYAEHGQRCFVLSISPTNVASNAMAKSLGFTRCAEHMDEEDGLEIIFNRRFETWPTEWTLEGVTP
jgi:[ribosomal protein S5]-alanine N-acetyltransferase